MAAVLGKLMADYAATDLRAAYLPSNSDVEPPHE
jgi:hypothetical protein